MSNSDLTESARIWATSMQGKNWVEWLTAEDPPAPPDSDWLTCDQIIQSLDRDSVKVSRSSLQSWEAIGILPLPVQKQRGGVTRALYPPWGANLIKGMLGKHIAEDNHLEIASWIGYAHSRLAQSYDRHTLHHSDPVLSDCVESIHKRYREMHGTSAGQIRLQILDGDGTLLDSVDFEFGSRLNI